MEIQQKIKTIPEKPGCYLYFNSHDKVIYVGKAKNLRSRVSSYFKNVLNAKTTKLVRDIVNVEVIVTKNEKEALLLEENLIKRYKPRYNIMLNDDKHYPYIVITNEQDPEYRYVRNYDKRYKRSFGPLPDGTGAGKILKMLQLLYPLRRCKGHLGKPCLYYHIDQCSGACFQEVDPNYYQTMIKKVDQFFRGNANEVKTQLQDKMFRAADNLQFEEAARIKNILDHLNIALFQQDVELKWQTDLDVFDWFIIDEYICVVVLFYLNGKLSFKDYVVFQYDGQSPDEILKSFMVQIYAKNIVPPKIVLRESVESYDVAELYPDAIEKNDKKYKSLLDLAHKNAEETLKMALLQSSTYTDKYQKILQSLQEVLKLPTFPSHIEMFDVANIYEEYVTGAMVVFKNGYASRNDFRKYNINIDQQDDFHRMQDMIYRRYQKDFSQRSKLPDIIIMDGGKIQVHAANSQLELLDISIPVIGLIKNEHHKTDRLLNWDGTEIEIKEYPEIFNFLANIQERVHNFAISSFRCRKEKGIFTNELESLPGVGPKMIKKIVEAFPSFADLKKASLDDIKTVVNSEKVSQVIYNHFQTKQK